ncbi:uncharacterized protein wu:fa19b12 isoform X2 [Brachionichthys hirsutus]
MRVMNRLPVLDVRQSTEYQWTIMAKRTAEDILLHDAASKRCYSPICSVSMQLGSTAPTGGGSPRSRKRPHYPEEPEGQEHAVRHVPPASGRFQDRLSAKRRPRDDRVAPEAARPRDAG